MQNIQYLGTKDNTYDNIKNHFYAIDVYGYEMGLDVHDDKTESVMITLFHWASERHREKLYYHAADAENCSFLKVYNTKRGRYFNYKGTRVYMPD
jgi:hypothetical protein